VAISSISEADFSSLCRKAFSNMSWLFIFAIFTNVGFLLIHYHKLSCCIRNSFGVNINQPLNYEDTNFSYHAAYGFGLPFAAKRRYPAIPDIQLYPLTQKGR
jgi:hypothetical protein